jgi:formylglycine-generating enzyme required for sulfatase activity
MALAIVGAVMLSGRLTQADDLTVQSFDATGQLTFSTLNDGTNYNYQVEWAPSPAGPWSPFTRPPPSMDNIVAAPFNIVAAPGSVVTSTVAMCYLVMFYRVVATLGDYLVVDLSGGTNAVNYPVSYYRSLADFPGGVGVNSDSYKTTNMVFRRIPAGTFTMGSPTNELGRNVGESNHVVTLTKPFYIGVFEVTQKQWERVMGTWPSYFTNATHRDARPVDTVSYNDIRGLSAGAGWPSNSNVDADSFMGRLRARTGKAFDLPTEAQWEYAGRAGTTTALNSGYDLTNVNMDAHVAEVGRYYYNGGKEYTANGDTTVGSAKVGSYVPNQWGLYDIHGNNIEWCLDWYDYFYYQGTVSDPLGSTSGSYRVMRGGYWFEVASKCRVASRSGQNGPEVTGINLGFRAALSPGQ